MITEPNLSVAEWNLIARCHKSKDALPQLAQAGRLMFWMMFSGVALFTGIVLWMYATKGAAGVPPGCQVYL